MTRRLCRRDVLKAAGLLAGAGVAAVTVVPRHVLGGPGNTPPSGKLNIAGVGIGGMGQNNIEASATENITALCDVDWAFAAKTFEKYPNANRYKDFRVMLGKEPSKPFSAEFWPSVDHQV